MTLYFCATLTIITADQVVFYFNGASAANTAALFKSADRFTNRAKKLFHFFRHTLIIRRAIRANAFI